MKAHEGKKVNNHVYSVTPGSANSLSISPSPSSNVMGHFQEENEGTEVRKTTIRR